jgi:hypothetical protein
VPALQRQAHAPHRQEPAIHRGACCNKGKRLKDYTKLDEAIVGQIKAGSVRFAAMLPALATVLGECRAAGEIPDDGSPAWRVVDRRLQHLSKAGRIAFSRSDNCWRVA